MAGTWMAQTGITAMIIDKKPSRTQVGHADGVESRTFEILDSFGMGDGVWKKANRTIDLSIWVSTDFVHLFNALKFESICCIDIKQPSFTDILRKDDGEPGGIQRGALLNNCNPGLSHFQEATLGQAQIEQKFLDFIDTSNSVQIKWNTCPVDLTLCEASDSPVRVDIESCISGTEVR